MRKIASNPSNSIPTAASSLSSLAASEAAVHAAAIDIDTYFRGSNGFFAPMQNSYPHGKSKFYYLFHHTVLEGYDRIQNLY